jgi:hypothetical protein
MWPKLNSTAGYTLIETKIAPTRISSSLLKQPSALIRSVIQEDINAYYHETDKRPNDWHALW